MLCETRVLNPAVKIIERYFLRASFHAKVVSLMLAAFSEMISVSDLLAFTRKFKLNTLQSSSYQLLSESTFAFTR